MAKAIHLLHWPMSGKCNSKAADQLLTKEEGSCSHELMVTVTPVTVTVTEEDCPPFPGAHRGAVAGLGLGYKLGTAGAKANHGTDSIFHFPFSHFSAIHSITQVHRLIIRACTVVS